MTGHEPPHEISWAPPWRVRVALLVGTWLVIELIALAGLHLLRVRRGLVYEPLATSSVSAVHRAQLTRLLDGQAEYMAHSPTLGWTIPPNGAAGSYRANTDGLRGDREYPAIPPSGTTRIAAFGDSFTHGDDVANSETWEVALEANTQGIEVLNFGVFGYGLDQAYLRWREMGIHYRPAVVLIGYLSENISRHVNVYRPFYRPATELPLAKPRFEVNADTLVLVPNPSPRLDDYRALLADPAGVLRRFGERDYYYTHTPHAAALDRSAIVRLVKLFYHEMVEAPMAPTRGGVDNEASEAFAITSRLLDRFIADVRTERATPLILVFPTRDDFRRRARGQPAAYQALLGHFDEQRLDYVELLNAFPDCLRDCDLDAIIPSHFSPAGNRVIGAYLARELRDRGLIGG